MVAVTYMDNVQNVTKEVFYNAVEIQVPSSKTSGHIILTIFILCMIMVCVISFCLKYKDRVQEVKD